MTTIKPQKIRDPVHNLIEFNVDQFEHTLWKIVQTRPFQRLRRIKQLGFSEFVFPGATHTRFSHSIGVFHVARQLIDLINKKAGIQFKDQQAHHALAAALLHDLGHGMFSHAFEEVAKDFKWNLARHENVSERIIREGEIAEILNKELGRGYSDNVADVIEQEIPSSLYGSIVSSQFDADRLDYMQRDRLMTGVQSSGVDPTWLLANLEVSKVTFGADDMPAGQVETLVLGPKATRAAEGYVLALFHLYPNVYLHKTTRGAEKIFQNLIRKMANIHRDGHTKKINLPDNHPIIRFFDEPSSLERTLDLDDTVFWGALPMLTESPDSDISRLAMSLRDRHLVQCFDIMQFVEHETPRTTEEKRKIRAAKIKLTCDSIINALKENERMSGRILLDQYTRNPYKRFQDSKSPMNQILIRTGDGPPTDMAELSPVIANAESFSICRAYMSRDDTAARDMIENIARTKLEEHRNGC